MKNKSLLILDNVKKTFLNKEFIVENKSIIIKGLIVFIIIVIAFASFAINKSDDDQISFKETTGNAQEKTSEESDSLKKIVVDVGGEVNNPTVVELSNNARVSDAIEAAGGLTNKANIKDINRAAKVTDGEKIYIPSKNDKTSSLYEGESEDNKKISINTGTSRELEEIPGVGPSTASKIIQYRDQNGKFTKIEDIKKVSGIGDKTFEKMKALISI